MLKGALAELAVRDPASLSTDVGPVITEGARAGIEAHIAAMAAAGFPVYRASLPPDCGTGSFVAPAIVEIPGIEAVDREVFGPVLHVLRFRRAALPTLLDRVNATGYALTFGVHSRIDGTVAEVVGRAGAGNIYVNRNVVGAVVGVQPFGGHGLSGTGPKAGGPLYLRRLLAAAPAETGLQGHDAPAVAAWDATFGPAGEPHAPLGVSLGLAGPVGEENRYETRPRGTVGCTAGSDASLRRQIRTALATGNRVLVRRGDRARLGPLPTGLTDLIGETDALASAAVDAVLFDGETTALLALGQALAARDGPIVPVFAARPDDRYPAEFLVLERSLSTNTTAADGNANLMMIG